MMRPISHMTREQHRYHPPHNLSLINFLDLWRDRSKYCVAS